LVPFFKKEYRKKAIPKALFTEIELAKIGKIEDELKEEFGEN
jgi:pyruvate/2-oxoglutarate dehydrogenase complex dihydrolipoamide dehydrogenase (E3) component